MAWSPVVSAQAPPVHRIEVPGSEHVRSGLVLDIDGDSLFEVAVAVSLDRSVVRRRLFVFSRPKAGAPFDKKPLHELDLTPDAVAWAVGDVHPRPGEEIVLFNARGAFVWLAGAPEEEAFVRLAEANYLWQATGSMGLFTQMESLVDWNGDGELDLALPEPGGCAFAPRLPGGAFGTTSRLVAPARGIAAAELEGDYPRWRAAGGDDGGGGGFQFAFGAPPGGDPEPGSEDEDDERRRGSSGLVSVVESVPAPQLVDWNGDGRLDVLLQGESLLHVWVQGAQGFAARPNRSLKLPVVADRTRRLDVSYSSHVVQLDGDGRADVVILSGDKRSDDVRTQLQVFLQGVGEGAGAKTDEAPLFGPKGIPQQLLVLAGFVAQATFPDLNGDGRADLFVRAIRPDLIDSIRSAASESIEADFYIYMNTGGRFSDRPDFSSRVQIPIKDFDLTMRFVGDINRDGWSDMLLRDRPERLRLLALWERRGKLELFDDPLLEVALHEDANIVPLREHGVLVLEDRRVMWVELP